jgi:N-acetylglutamate synthase-like GNAT family acetyltransferase
MAAMEIRYLADHPEFLPQLSAWLHDEWDHMYPGATVDSRRKRLENQMRRREIPLTVVAFEGGTLMGSASLIESDLADRPELTPWLASVFVAAGFRRRGIGGRLVRAIMDEAGGLGVERLYLWTDKEADFYASMGWTRLFEREYKTMNITVMSRDLPRA